MNFKIMHPNIYLRVLQCRQQNKISLFEGLKIRPRVVVEWLELSNLQKTMKDGEIEKSLFQAAKVVLV